MPKISFTEREVWYNLDRSAFYSKLAQRFTLTFKPIGILKWSTDLICMCGAPSETLHRHKERMQTLHSRS